MAFYCKVDDDVYMVYAEHFLDLLAITDIAALKGILPAAKFTSDIHKIRETANIGELVVINDRTHKFRSP